MKLRAITKIDVESAKGRLIIYKRALKDYTERRKHIGEIDDGFFNRDRSIFDCGLCYYFYKRYIGLDTYFHFSVFLPELYSFKPEESSSDWFPMGHLSPRIECIKKAILITEEKIKNEG